MHKFGSAVVLVLSLSLGPVLLGGCTSTVRLEVAPINIYAKLDANVRIQLDKEVQSLIAKNPDLF
jgi:hypothetical protein